MWGGEVMTRVRGVDRRAEPRGVVYGRGAASSTCDARVRVPFESPLHWIIQIGLSTDFRYMTCRVRGTHGLLYEVMSTRCPAVLHSPHTPSLLAAPVPLLVRSLLVPVPLSVPGDQPNGIIDERLAPEPGGNNRLSERVPSIILLSSAFVQFQSKSTGTSCLSPSTTTVDRANHLPTA